MVVQTDALPLSTVVVLPTSTRARPTSFRPAISVKGETTQVLTEQVTAVDTDRLGGRVARLGAAELARVDQALRDVLGLF